MILTGLPTLGDPQFDKLTSVEEALMRLTSGEERWKLGKCRKVWKIVNALLNTPALGGQLPGAFPI